MTIKWQYKMFKTTGIPILTLILLSFLLAIIPEASLYITSVFAQNITQSQENNGGEQILHIIKDATNSYTISSGASFVGSFDTTYSIVGDARSMEASKDLITSTVTEDFGNSPTVGYVNNTNTSSASQVNLNQPSLPNPFATKADIDEKISSEITTSIDNAAKSDLIEGEIKCIFGSSLDDFKCSFHPLSG
jgi:hypothetical protein